MSDNVLYKELELEVWMQILDKVLYKPILDNLDNGIFFIDRKKMIIYWNKAAEKLSGYKRSEVFGMPCEEVLKHVDEHGNEFCLDGRHFDELFDNGGSRKEELYMHHKEGHRIPVKMSILPMKNVEGDVIGAAEMISDNSEKLSFLQRIEELQKLALLDPLTGLANRRYLEKQVGANINEMERYGWPFGLAFIDIDRFKKVNDTYGHDIGDEVLKMLGRTLEHNLRTSDVAGRWGGEEFVAIIVNVTKDQLKTIADKLRIMVRESNLSTDSGDVSVTVSIGATISRSDDTVATIVKRTDNLMYESKEAGRNRLTMD